MRLILTIFLFLSMTVASGQSDKEEQITLTGDNTIVLNSSFTGASVSALITQAKKQDSDLKSGYPMYLFLDTPGGSIQAGLELVEYLKGLNRPVHTVTLFAASMGWQLLQHLGTRYVLKYGVLMSHKAYGGFRGEFGGSGSQLDSRYSFYLRRINMMDEQTVTRTRGVKTLKTYQSEYDNELWLNGGEAVRNGYADKVVNAKCDKGLLGTRDKIIRWSSVSIVLSFDKCPLVTYPLSITVKVRTNKGYMELDDFMSQGGIFGKKCSIKGKRAPRGWNGKIIGKGVAPELCLMDKTLTLAKIDKMIKKEKDKIRNRKSNIIRMSFGNFVSEF